ncbi:helix-hairpin-helix motif family protein [Mycobacterium xenopi 4042]|uniref:Helix-hairpin-helix motif family protein n=1 Tax=Mycobacterium xenopi 4042 TaxID=1299334 RepID=X7YQD2_MYCXE|nr:helix-hairpin-helix motif family protein [Mycobacterium xenopi 4042]EUA34898.1 helix-hairpin-helix motif family protein [Mycobacterium xenopi 3993]
MVTHFGSLARLREATVEEITAVPGIGVATATAVLEALRSDTSTDRVPERASG